MEQVLNNEENQIEPPREHLLKMSYWAAVGGSQQGAWELGIDVLEASHGDLLQDESDELGRN